MSTSTAQTSQTEVPFFIEKVPCGFPSPGSDCKESPLDFNELLTPHKSATYCIRAGGDSMVDAGIFAEDILVVDRSIRPIFGDIVVAEYDGGFTVKRLARPTEPGLKAVLHPENPNYPDLPIAETTELIIFGVVSAVVRCMRREKKK